MFGPSTIFFLLGPVLARTIGPRSIPPAPAITARRVCRHEAEALLDRPVQNPRRRGFSIRCRPRFSAGNVNEARPAQRWIASGARI